MEEIENLALLLENGTATPQDAIRWLYLTSEGRGDAEITAISVLMVHLCPEFSNVQ